MKSKDFAKSAKSLIENEKKPKCKVFEIKLKLVDEDLAAFDSLMDSEVPGLKVAKFLNQEGFAIGETSVRKHRNKQCNCEFTK